MGKKANKLADANSAIRDFVNNSTVKRTHIFSKKHDGDWSKFCSALDLIGDTCLAVDGFQADTKESFANNPYLQTYGFLQALYIQQNAVGYLKVSLFGNQHKIDWKNNPKYSELMKIRQLRNETVGHPISAQQKTGKQSYSDDGISSCTIDRSSLSKNGFSYTLWMNSRTERKSINFDDVIEIQESNLSVELTAIMNQLKKEERAHKRRFKGELLSSYLKVHSLYEINLIYGADRGDHLAWPSLNHFEKIYKKIRTGLESRYGKFGAITRIPGTELVINKLDYVFSKLASFRDGIAFDSFELEVYVDALDVSLKELQKHLVEIDNEFKI